MVIVSAHNVHELRGMMACITAEIHAMLLTDIVGLLAKDAERRVLLDAGNVGWRLKLPLGNVEKMSVCVNMKEDIWIRPRPDAPGSDAMVEIFIMHPRFHLVHDRTLWVKVCIALDRVDNEKIIRCVVMIVGNKIDRVVLELGIEHVASVPFCKFLR